MASSQSAKSSFAPPKPRGVNVRAFIETVEGGSKPKPDFFNTETELQEKIPKAFPKPKKGSTRSGPKPCNRAAAVGQKPPVLYKKPALAKGNAAKRSVAISSPREPPPPPPCGNSRGGTLGTHTSEDEGPVGDLNYPSEDSGSSTCDLKYSGSISSNQSSSHDPTYQALSEVDDGYSERTGSSNYDVSSTVHEVPQYCEPSHATSSKNSLSTKTHHSAYKYHVPGRLTGTLPRDKKKAAFIGKAVAKGRNTLKKKPSSSASEKAGDDNSTTISSAKDTSNTLNSSTCMTDSVDRESDFDFTDSEFDTDYSDAELETDGEQKINKSNTNAAADSPSILDSKRESLPPQPRLQSNDADSDATDYGTPCIVEKVGTGLEAPHSSTTNSHPKSKSTFYIKTPEEESKKLVTLMKDHSSKKEKQAMLKKSPDSPSPEAFILPEQLKNIKGNLLEFKQKSAVQNFVKNSNTRLAAVKIFIGGKFKKPVAVPTPDYEADYNDGTEAKDTGSVLSVEVAESAMSDTYSEVLSVSSHNSQQHSPPHPRVSGASMSSTSLLIPRQKSGITTEDLRLRTQSLGALIVPPPLPPRNIARSHDLSEAASLGSLPPPPPPPRTTSTKQSLLTSATNEGASGISPAQSCLSNTSTPGLPVGLLSSLEGGASVLALPSVPTRNDSSKSSTILTTRSLDESSKCCNEIFSSSTSSPPPTGDGASRSGSFQRTSPQAAADEKKRSSVHRKSSGVEALLLPPSAGPVLTEGDEVREELIEDEPLYQEYHECMISSVRPKSIHRASTLMRGGQPNFSLWSTTPAVINSGVLDKMNNEEIKLQEAMFEVVSSEASYLRSIKMLNNVFINSAEFCNEEILPAREKKALFSNIPAVLDVSERLFKELESHWKESIILTAVCEIISKYAYRDFDVYVKYCSNQSFQDRALKKLISQNPGFTEALTNLEKSSECHGLSMSSFLLLPMQRITRLPLLLDAIQRRQEMFSEQYKHAERCYGQVKKIVSRCNEGARKMEQTEQVLSIENKLIFNKLKKVALTSSSRQLVKKGDLIYLSADGGRSTANLLSVKPKNLSLFLFNDLLLITKKKDKGEAFSVLDYASRVNVEVEEWIIGNMVDPRLISMAHKSQAKFMFMLVLLENHQKKHSEYLLSCHTETERTRWIEAFSPQTQGDTDDKIYEAWDCPQVQITHDYAAQQPDELSLEIGAIVNVLRKTADGWYECQTVSDGQTGWVPSSYTVELQNEHVRARHLKDRYKLLQAAAKLMK